MDHSFAHSFSFLSIADNHPTPNTSLPSTLNSLTSLDFPPHYPSPFNQKQSYEPSTVLLFKGIPEDASELEILDLCHPFGTIKDILIARHKRYVFIQFETVDQAINCYKAFIKFAPNLKGYPLYVCYTGKERINKPDSLLGPPSRYLLIIFHKENYKIDTNLIYQLLRSFGKCLNIVVFQTQPTQAFVEMEDVTQAILAKENLDGKNLTVVYTEERDIFKEQAKQEAVFSPKSHLSPLAGQYHAYSMPEIHMTERREHEITRAPSTDQLNKNMALLAPLIRTKEEKASNILLVKNLPKNISARVLFRLFGVCGNVMKVKIFFKNPENALVEYQDSYQASLAKLYLNNCPLGGNNIFIANSKEGIFIDTSILKKGEETQYMGDYSSSTEHRYKFAGSKNHSNIAQPSKVLHLSNLCDDKSEGFYRELFRPFGDVRKFIFLKGSDKMALMEMESISDAVNVLVNLHNYNINGKFLKVSFSKYPKIKEFK